MADLDLDALRAAREEQQGAEARYILFGGEKFEVPSEPPWDFALALTRGDPAAAFAVLLGDDSNGDGAPSAFARFMAHRPSTRDIEALIENLDELYPASPGKASSNSDTSSDATSAKSKRTSSASTGST